MKRIVSLTGAVCVILLPLFLPGCQQAVQEKAVETSEVETPGGTMIAVPGGWFMRGSETGEDDERPIRRIRVDSFLMDKCEVTQAEYRRLMAESPAKFKGDSRPVEQVSWAAAAFYCNARSEEEGLTPCYDPETGACDFDADGYRLPTEAEWEYACRAGSDADFAFGDDENRLATYAWYQDNAGDETHPVGEKRPNAWGFCDMHGNVAEWCNDVYSDHYYEESPDRNPKGPPEPADPHFVLRGGSWNSTPNACRSAFRAHEKPGQIDGCFARDDLGFRCVRKAPAEPASAG